MKKIIITSFLVLTGLFIFFEAQARTGCPQTGIVPCGTEGCPCTFCDFFVMFDRIVDFLLVPCIYNSYFPLIPALATLMLVIGGFIYIFAYSNIAEGGPEQFNKAKRLFGSIVIGLLIAYGAWLGVNLFFQLIGVQEWTGLKEGWWEIECESSGDRSKMNKVTCLFASDHFWMVKPSGEYCVAISEVKDCNACNFAHSMEAREKCCSKLGTKCEWVDMEPPLDLMTCRTSREGAREKAIQECKNTPGHIWVKTHYGLGENNTFSGKCIAVSEIPCATCPNKECCEQKQGECRWASDSPVVRCTSLCFGLSEGSCGQNPLCTYHKSEEAGGSYCYPKEKEIEKQPGWDTGSMETIW